MADWVLTPRTDFCEIYNVRRKDEPRRKLVQGELTNRPGLGGIRGRMENLAYQDGESYISDRRVADPTSYTNNQSKYTNPSFRFGNTSQSGHQANNLAGYHAKTGSRSNIIGRQSLLPSEKYGKRRSGENFKDYTNFGHRLFGKSPRKMKQYGSTVDRVRNIEEKNNYARLLATITDEKMICVPPTTNKYSNFRPTHVRNRDDDVIVTGVEKSTNQRSSYGQAPSWEPVDDSLLYMRTTQDLTAGVKPHCLRPWNNNSNQKVKSKTTVTNGNTRFRAPRDHSTPFTNQRSGLFVESTNRRQSYRTSTNGEREDSDDDDKIWTNQNQASSTDQNASLGLTGFVRRVREGLQTKRTVDDVLCIDDDVTKWMTSPTERKEGRSPRDRKKRSPLIRKVTSPRCVLSRVREVIDLEKPNDDDEDDVVLLHNDDEVEVVLEVLTPNKSRNNRDGSPDVITIEAPPMTSSRQRDGLEERLKAIPYADRAWVRLQREESEERAKAFLRSRVVAEMEIKVFDESRKKQTERLEEAIKKQLRIAELVPAVIEEPEEEEEEDVYPELTTEMENVVDSALYGGPPSQVLVDHMRIQIRRSDVQTLEGTTWLNDEVINFHMNLMTQRGEEEGRPKVHAFNTFFYQKLVQQGHSSLKRWTRKIDVFSKDYLVVPVHLQMHWCMAIVDFRKKEIRYYDSMGGRNNVCLKAVKKYLEEESIDKQKKTYDTSAWQLINAKGPQQMNGSDCGVFSTICAEHVTRDAPLTYTQDLMPYFRRRMVYEIMSKKLMQ